MSLVPSLNQNTASTRMDAEYYMNAEFVVFQVENVLFRVPTYALVSESDVFATMFTLPLGDKPNAEGASSKNPIKLPEEIKSEDFKALLKLLYPLKPFTNPSSSQPNLTREQWMATLTLATKWRYLELRKVALQALQKIRRSSIEKITLGRTLSISKWVLEGYQELANVDDTTSITEEQAAAIGWETTVKLQRVREERLRNRNNTAAFTTSSPASTTPTSGAPIFNFSVRKVETSVEDVFKGELAQIRSAELHYFKSKA